MKFCVKCDNMYYNSIPDDNPNKLVYYCKNCGHVDDIVASTNTLILSKNLSSEHSITSKINEYTKFDPTLPRTDKVGCPNDKCPTNVSDEPKEIIYIRYDDANMKYVYLCTTCDKRWVLQNN